MQPAVFLDRDNTLINNDGDMGDPSEVRLMDGVAPGLEALRDAGFTLVVVTNQGGVARGKFSEEDVDAVHQRIAMLVDSQARRNGLIDRFYYCPYHPDGTVAEYTRDHPWRKPHPGMILQAAQDMEIDLSRSWMIGDQERDVMAGRAAGCRVALVTRDVELAQRTQPTEVAASFEQAVKLILRQARKGPTADQRDTRNGEPVKRRPTAAGGSAVVRGGTPSVGTGAARERAAVDRPAPATRVPETATTSSVARGPTEAPTERPSPSPTLPIRVEGSSSSQGPPGSPGSSGIDLAGVRRAIGELTEEIRSDRLRRSEFTMVKMMAGVCQLLAILLAVLGLMQMSNTDVFIKWMIGAGLMQMVAITFLVLDLKA